MNTITVARPNKCLKCYACLVLAVPLLVLEGSHLVRELLGQVAHLSERERDGRGKVSRGSRGGSAPRARRLSKQRNYSGAVSVASRTSVLRWSTASVIACMGEESLLVWTCGLMTRNACQSSSMDARRGEETLKMTHVRGDGTNSPWGRRVAVRATR